MNVEALAREALMRQQASKGGLQYSPAPQPQMSQVALADPQLLMMLAVQTGLPNARDAVKHAEDIVAESLVSINSGRLQGKIERAIAAIDLNGKAN